MAIGFAAYNVITMSKISIFPHKITIIVLCLIFASPAFSQLSAQTDTVKFNATIIELDGEVLVNQGEKYVPAKKGMRVKNGDRIMVMQSGKAKIKYDNSCTDSAETFSIYEVDNYSACPPVFHTEQPTIAQAAPATSATNPGVIGTLITLGIVLLDDDDDRRRAVSP